MSKDNKDDLENLGMQSNEELFFSSLALIDLLNSSGSSGSSGFRANLRLLLTKLPIKSQL